MGLGVHNFHDAQRKLPPSTVSWYRAAFWTLFLPYYTVNGVKLVVFPRKIVHFLPVSNI